MRHRIVGAAGFVDQIVAAIARQRDAENAHQATVGQVGRAGNLVGEQHPQPRHGRIDGIAAGFEGFKSGLDGLAAAGPAQPARP